MMMKVGAHHLIGRRDATGLTKIEEYSEKLPRTRAFSTGSAKVQALAQLSEV
jgi:hypothetical protein